VGDTFVEVVSAVQPDTTVGRYLARRGSWEASFGELVNYVGTQGHANPPQSIYTHSGLALGRWVSAQRRAYRCRTTAASLARPI
jgi:hypothetical protein